MPYPLYRPEPGSVARLPAVGVSTGLHAPHGGAAPLPAAGTLPTAAAPTRTWIPGIVGPTEARQETRHSVAAAPRAVGRTFRLLDRAADYLVTVALLTSVTATPLSLIYVANKVLER